MIIFNKLALFIWKVWSNLSLEKIHCLLNEINSCKEYATYQTLLSLFLFLCFIRLVSTNWRSALLHALGGCKAMIIRVRFAMLYTTGGKSKKPWWWCSVKVRVGSIPFYPPLHQVLGTCGFRWCHFHLCAFSKRRPNI